MSERAPRPQPEQSDWSRAAVGEALDALPQHARDVAWGDGTAYHIGVDPDQPLLLEVFPAAGVARLTSRQAEVTLFRQDPPSIYEEEVRFEQETPEERLRLTLTRRGRISLQLAPQVTDAPKTAGAMSERPASQDEGQTGVLGPLVTPEDPSSRRPEPPAAPGEQSEDAERGERVRLVGRLGAAPSFRTTRNDVLIGTFPLAVRVDEERTDWHTVRAFKDRAEKLRELELKKGQFAEVIGYRHEVERKARDGTKKAVTEIYAAHVKPR